MMVTSAFFAAGLLVTGPSPGIGIRTPLFLSPIPADTHNDAPITGCMDFRGDWSGTCKYSTGDSYKTASKIEQHDCFEIKFAETWMRIGANVSTASHYLRNRLYGLDTNSDSEITEYFIDWDTKRQDLNFSGNYVARSNDPTVPELGLGAFKGSYSMESGKLVQRAKFASGGTLTCTSTRD